MNRYRYKNDHSNKNKVSRLAIINYKKCKPTKCNHECKRKCPPNLQGAKCIEIENIPNSIEKKRAKINENLCIGCGTCTRMCPFDAIQIVNLPTELEQHLVYSYGENSFKLYKLITPKQGNVVGIIGQNGIGKSTLLSILSGKIKPTINNNDKNDIKEILNTMKGTEKHKYFSDLYDNKLSVQIKHQNIISVVSQLKKGKRHNMLVNDAIKKHYTSDNTFHKKIIFDLELEQIKDNKIINLSGGELQRLLCALILMQNANVYIFDEPTNYLDVRQRLKVASLIRELVTYSTHNNTSNTQNNRYVFIVEHDLSILDYTSDYIHIMYGTPAAFGAISSSYATSNGVNTFFSGYLPAENIRFRLEPFNFKETLKIEFDNSDSLNDQNKDTSIVKYSSGSVKYDTFELNISEGKLMLSNMIVLVGKNGTGKTTYLKYLSDNLNYIISTKPQYIEIEKFKNKDDSYHMNSYSRDSYPRVGEFLMNNIKKAMVSDMFKADVIRQLDIEKLYDKYLDKLSGGELQRVMVAYCLGHDAHIYLIDEPSASLDIEQRAIMTRVIKRFLIHNNKIGFIVEHDIMMAMSIGLERGSKIIVFDTVCNSNDSNNNKNNNNNNTNTKRISTASPPLNFNKGINKFLAQLDITFRTDKKVKRPRINKIGSTKDQEQKIKKKYFD